MPSLRLPPKLYSNISEAARHFDATSEDNYKSARHAFLWTTVETYINCHREDFTEKGGRLWVYPAEAGQVARDDGVVLVPEDSEDDEDSDDDEEGDTEEETNTEEETDTEEGDTEDVEEEDSDDGDDDGDTVSFTLGEDTPDW